MSGFLDLRLGFIPLTDCAPLAVAKTMGFFAEEGLEVELSREASWATVRDKVAVGALDGAHMLAPMALAANGVAKGAEEGRIIAPLALNRNGSAVTVSSALAEAMRAVAPSALDGPLTMATALAGVAAARRTRGEPPLTFAVVFPASMHNYLLRYWLAEGGIDPDQDVRIVVIPPPRMVEQMRAGAVDGFCVGAPWNAVAEAEGVGRMLITASQFWPSGPDKILGMAAGFAASRPDDLKACLRAVMRAAAWADAPENREALVELLARPEWIGAAPETIARALRGEIVFHRDGAGLPRPEHGLWFASQMVRWGQVESGVDLAALVHSVYRPDLYRAAALSLDPILDPAISFEDAAQPVEARLFDRRLFDPAAPAAYAASFAIGRARR
ncbi:NitT/TauT family transport system ATP-binding protein/nitrate/nitrite transport system substrate-binding protein [Caulobacter sp. BE264]|uniref:CmpA/NrtA family ABC transporter substrate-binding protein n=1 Tax=Caulobacter sp. BE264 TaxID=2817724 RepID=UPI0028602619|nr:CmpA/NrtA family ABC transporter substrate-binding protein [Caulobacter sp. BE264]MDR7229676.1 NitT/TauT family transport system ATP-binding protein/nitrate/nitrite transport system substrate-binding protein [Caulobacter sp. BE264]